MARMGRRERGRKSCTLHGNDRLLTRPRQNANNFYNDDILQRCGILWIMALLILYGNNANEVGNDIHALRATVGAYNCIRFTQLSFFFLYSVASHHHRTQNRIYAGLTFLGLCLWIPLYFESVSHRAKIAVAVVAILWEETAYILGFSPFVSNMLKLEFTTAVDIGHEDDRYTAFTIIVLGEFTYAILVGYASSDSPTNLITDCRALQIAGPGRSHNEIPPRRLDTGHSVLLQFDVCLH